MFSRRKDKNMKSKDYAKTGTYYLVGNLFNKGIAFLTIIIYTRILTAYDYGIINTFSSWVGILSMILGMSLQNSIRVAFVDFKEKIDDFLSSIISLTLIVGMFLSVLILSVCVFIRINTNIGIVILCLAQSLFTAIIEDYSMYLMMKYRYKQCCARRGLSAINLYEKLGVIFLSERIEYSFTPY